MLPPILVSLWFDDGQQMVFVAAFFGLLAVGMLLWTPFRHSSGELRRRDGFLIVSIVLDRVELCRRAAVSSRTTFEPGGLPVRSHFRLHLIHPKLVRPIRIGKHPLKERTVESIWAFFSVYIAVFAILTLLMMLAGLDWYRPGAANPDA